MGPPSKRVRSLWQLTFDSNDHCQCHHSLDLIRPGPIEVASNEDESNPLIDSDKCEKSASNSLGQFNPHRPSLIYNHMLWLMV